MIAGSYKCGLWKKRPEAAPFQVRMHPFHYSKMNILLAEIEPIGNTGCASGKADLRKMKNAAKIQLGESNEKI